MFRLSAGKQAASKAVTHVGQTARAAYTSAHGIENETWIDADVNTVDGDASFSNALTVDELSASREHLERSFAPASDDASSSASTEDSVDADGQMMSMQSNALFHSHAQQRAVFDAACAMANDSRMQAAAFEAMRSNPDVLASMQHLAAQHGMSLSVDPSATERRLGTAYLGQNGPPRPAVRIEELDGAEDKQAQRNPFVAFADLINDALDGAGEAVVAYVGRMRRRIARLSAQLQGLPPPHFVGAGDPTAEPRKGGAAEDEGTQQQQQHEPEGNLLKDIVVTVASLIITVAFVGRIGRLGRMRF